MRLWCVGGLFLGNLIAFHNVNDGIQRQLLLADGISHVLHRISHVLHHLRLRPCSGFHGLQLFKQDPKVQEDGSLNNGTGSAVRLEPYNFIHTVPFIFLKSFLWWRHTYSPAAHQLLILPFRLQE